MVSEPLTRKLSAILYADVAGYSRLTGQDEEETHRTLSHSLDLISSEIARYRGKVVHYAGDAVLADFDTAFNAASCAVAIQGELARRNASRPEPRRLRFRIGINLGDVIVDRGDIYGNGVNVAARLESLAEAGGICVSEAVRDALGNRLPLEFDYLGERRVKNIEEPVRAYHARLEPGARTPEPIPRTARRARPRALGAAAIGLLVIAAAVLYLRDGTGPEAPASGPPPPRGQSVAVLPFSNMSGDASQEYFADGISEDLTTDLARIPGLFVIARNSAFTYKGKPVDVRRVGKELGVSYVLEGSVRRAGDTLRVNVQLVDTGTGRHLWADRYDGTPADVFGLQDQVTRRVVEALALNLAGGAPARRPETEDVAAYDAFLAGRTHFLRRSPEDLAEAERWFRKAIEIDPDYSRAYAALAATYLDARVKLWYGKLGLASRYAAEAEARKYLRVALRVPTPLAHRVAARLLSLEGRHEEAVAAAERAVALDTNDPASHARLAASLIWAGRAAEALAPIARSMRLDPRNPSRYVPWAGIASFATGRFANAAALLGEAAVRNPKNYLPMVHLIAAYGHLGRRAQAESTLTRMNALRREIGAGAYSIELTRRLAPYDREEDLERLVTGLRRAGVPESAAE